MSTALFLDVIVASLLVATITYAVILNRKLGQLRADRSGFEKMLKQFVAATDRAENGVALLQRVADASAAELDAKRDSTLRLRDDMEFLVSRAEEQAGKLERLIAAGRDRELPRERVRDVPRAASRPARATAPADGYLFETPSDASETPDQMPEEPAAMSDAEIDFDATPAWLASARKLAGVAPVAEEALR